MTESGLEDRFPDLGPCWQDLQNLCRQVVLAARARS